MAAFAFQAAMADQGLRARLGICKLILAQLTGRSRTNTSRIQMVAYFTSEEWEGMKHELSNVNHIRDCIFHRAMMLGARSPSEDTKRIFACMMLMLKTRFAQR